MSDFSEIRRLQDERKADASENDRIALNSRGQFDSDIYGGSDDKGKYMTSLPAEDDDLDNDDYDNQAVHPSTRARINAPRALLDLPLDGGESNDITAQYREQFGSGIVNTRIADRESEVNILTTIYTLLHAILI